MDMILEASDNDNLTMATQSIRAAAMLNSPEAMQDLLRQGLRRSASKNSLQTLSYLIEQGADVHQLAGRSVIDSMSDDLPSPGMLEILVANGWDLDSRGPGLRGEPVLWSVVKDTSLVECCLDHGASVDPPDDTPPGKVKQRKPILERAAIHGNIAAFELLRARGAPMFHNFGVLPVAVMMVNDYAPDVGQQPDAHYRLLMDMVRHLIDVVKCDVNAVSYGAHYRSGSTCSTPLCWIACHMRGDARELIWCLLERGGDPNLDLSIDNSSGGTWSAPSALDAATRNNSQRFLQIVEEWQALHPGGASDGSQQEAEGREREGVA